MALTAATLAFEVKQSCLHTVLGCTVEAASRKQPAKIGGSRGQLHNIPQARDCGPLETKVYKTLQTKIMRKCLSSDNDGQRSSMPDLLSFLENND